MNPDLKKSTYLSPGINQLANCITGTK